MEKTYELFKKYAKMMSDQDYHVGEAAMLMLDTDNGVYSTRYGADLANLKMSDIEKINIKALPMSRSGMKAMVYSQTPYCQKALREARPFKPSIDDMAQIIGPAAYIADGRDSNRNSGKSLKKALKKNTGCMVLRGVGANGKGKGYTVTVGRNLYEAVVAMTVLEKSAEITYLADQLGGVKFLDPVEARLMRLVYKKKYSKAEESAKTAETSEGVITAAETAEIPECEKTQEQILREKLVEYGKKLVKSGLVQGTWGNLSVRLDKDYMLVTPSGLDYMRLTPADMVKVNINTLEYEGNLKPTSEKGLHAEVYKRRNDVGSVIHTHSKYCCVFAAAEQPMPVEDKEMQKLFGTEIPLAEYGLPGSKKLMANTVDALGDKAGCIMSHHGMMACGSDLEDAYRNCADMEECGKKYLGQ
ncbi:MAG: class II aldolase/adducin family protein [Firmicutes bacterium]|nr:class II aldolase/adducin family protein [Bacillota bacterium]